MANASNETMLKMMAKLSAGEFSSKLFNGMTLPQSQSQTASLEIILAGDEPPQHFNCRSVVVKKKKKLKKKVPRWYQDESTGSLMNFLDTEEGHPLVVAPTGTGKTYMIQLFIEEYLSEYPEDNVLVLSHVKEILWDNYKELENHYGDWVGLYSAGFLRREVKKITVAGIQSIWRRSEEFQKFGLIIIDEAHLIPFDGEGMYRNFLNKMDATYVGFTATPFRMSGGYLHKAKGAIFTDVVYDLSSRENFSRLVEEGYLSRLIMKGTDTKLDPTGVKITAGDYNLAALSNKFDRDSITIEIVDEIIKTGKNYKQWLLFCIDIEHAENVTAELERKGVKTACVHSKMADRDKVLARVKKNKYRATVNVDILTTGFNHPAIDLIALLASTKSPVKYIQEIGRGLRIAKGKDHCLVLDFGRVVENLGPIDAVKLDENGHVKGDGEAILKTCPECGGMAYPAVKECVFCGHEFLFKHGLTNTAATGNISGRSEPEWLDVDSVDYSIHRKSDKPDSLKVRYRCGLTLINEWVCLQHGGRPSMLARKWVSMRTKFHVNSTHHLYQLGIENRLKVPKQILVDNNSKFLNVNGYKMQSEFE